MYYYFLSKLIIVFWLVNIFFTVRYCKNAFTSQKINKTDIYIGIIIALAVIIPASFINARGGYDNNHDFLCLSYDFLTENKYNLFNFKEVAPLFTDTITNIISSYSLKAILVKNVILSVVSMSLFYLGLKTVCKNSVISATITVLLFLNFNTALSAKSFATTQSNILIFITSYLSIFNAFTKKTLSRNPITWVITTLILVTATRIEFVPVNLLLIATLIIYKVKAKDFFFLKRWNQYLIGIGIAFMIIFGLQAIKDNPARLLNQNSSLMTNINFHLSGNNLSVIRGYFPKYSVHTFNKIDKLDKINTSIFLLIAIPGILIFCFKHDDDQKVIFYLTTPIIIWCFYFAYIFFPQSNYPLHFTRHHLYFFIPFCLLQFIALNGYFNIFKNKTTLKILCCLFCGVYFALNVRAEIALNKQMRTNDIEWNFLLNSKESNICSNAKIYFNDNDLKSHVVRRYFKPNKNTDKKCYFISSYPFIFNLKTAIPDDITELYTIRFHHKFYTTMPNEKKGSIPLTIGFFEKEN